MIDIGTRKEFNRNPNTGHIRPFLAEQPHPVSVELTLMLAETHDYGLFHRLEREVNGKKPSGRDWTYREFNVSGPGEESECGLLRRWWGPSTLGKSHWIHLPHRHSPSHLSYTVHDPFATAG